MSCSVCGRTEYALGLCKYDYERRRTGHEPRTEEQVVRANYKRFEIEIQRERLRQASR